MQKTLAVTQVRYDFYANIAFMNAWEIAPFVLNGFTLEHQAAATVLNLIGATSHLLPNAHVGVAGLASPFVTALEGGSNVGNSLNSFAEAARGVASTLSTAAGMTATLGSYQRRQDEWTLQKNIASKELDQINQQIAAGQIRSAIAETEIDNQNKQIANAQAVQDFLQTKYTNQDLYAWMISQTSSVFFQCYQLAYDMAKRAEAAFRFERGLTDSTFIAFGYWDNLKNGLLSGEQLYLDLKRGCPEVCW